MADDFPKAGQVFGYHYLWKWQATRGARSGRVAWQFFTDLAGRHGLAV